MVQIPKIAAVVMTDGRQDCIEQSIESFSMFTIPFSHKIIHNDSPSTKYHRWLKQKYGKEFEIVWTQKRSGFGGAIQSAWRHLSHIKADYIWHHEDDFVVEKFVDLYTMSRILDKYPNIKQIALRRQAWNSAEIEAGGVVELNPYLYKERTDAEFGVSWLEQRSFWTTNPSLYRKSTIQRGWPDGLNSEGRFGISLFQEDGDARCAYWGSRDSGEWVTHIGVERAGSGY